MRTLKPVRADSPDTSGGDKDGIGMRGTAISEDAGQCVVGRH